MATAVLNPSVTLGLSVTEYKPNLAVGGVLTSSIVHSAVRSLALGVGTGANNIDTVWSARASIASGTPLDTDLRGSIASVLDGTTLNFPLVVLLLVINNSATTGQSLAFGVGANPVTSWMTGTTPTITIGAGGWLQLASPIDGYATTAATADIMRIASTTGTVVTDIVLLGRQS
jgi:molybdopterin-binding protein